MSRPQSPQSLKLQTHTQQQMPYNPNSSRQFGRSSTKQSYEKIITNYSYNLDDKLGQGQFSVVFKGKNIYTKKIVAVKVIQMKQISNQIFLTLLNNEIAILKMLKNPNLLSLCDVYTTAHNIYIITEYCDQGDLNNYIKSKGRLNEDEALKILKHLLLGLLEIQKNYIIHRDIKPANILISDGIPKFADFGFAVQKEISQNANLANFNVGTPLYMSPESLINNMYSFKSDIWSLGIVLYEMLYGSTPFQSASEEQLKIKLQEYCSSKELNLKNIKISVQTKQILRGMLEYDPVKRYALQDLFQTVLTPSKSNTQDNTYQLPAHHQTTYQSQSTKNSPQKENFELNDVPIETESQKPYIQKLSMNKREKTASYFLSKKVYEMIQYSTNELNTENQKTNKLMSPQSPSVQNTNSYSQKVGVTRKPIIF